MASAAYRPIHDAARALTSGAPELPQPYFVSPSDYGADVPGKGRIPFPGLGRSAKAITSACLVYALASVSKLPCRIVLLDDLDVVQRSHRAPLLSAFARALKAGLVDNVFVTMATDPGEVVSPIEGVTIHVVTPQSGAVAPVAAPTTVVKKAAPKPVLVAPVAEDDEEEPPF